jgi:hypothetical protein
MIEPFYSTRRVLVLATVTLLVTAVACSPQPSVATSDPFAYCTAVGTIDTPDSRYTGPRMPDAIAQGLKQASGASADAPTQLFTDNAFWRCADGKVLACTVGANLPCTEKADTSRTPTQAEMDFCQANPAAEVIPAAVTGRATVYEWKCTNGSPEIVKQVAEVDAQGYLAHIWYIIPPQ